MLVEKRESIGIITFDRPEAMNALNTGVLKELEEAIDRFEKDLDIRAVIFTGNGKAFISGADLDEMKDLRDKDARAFIDRGTSLFRRLELLEIPTIAAVNGFCFGGGLELALCTDIRLASEKASFSFPEASLGIIPGFSGTQRLPRTVGKSNAKEMLFTGKRVKAQEALEMGLVNHLYPLDELMGKAMELAEMMVRNSPNAISKIKMLVEKGVDMELEEGITLESDYSAPNFESRDQIEGIKAFFEKRKPNYRR